MRAIYVLWYLLYDNIWTLTNLKLKQHHFSWWWQCWSHPSFCPEVIFEIDERMISRHLVFGIAKHNQLEETFNSPVLPITMVNPLIVEVSRWIGCFQRAYGNLGAWPKGKIGASQLVHAHSKYSCLKGENTFWGPSNSRDDACSGSTCEVRPIQSWSQTILHNSCQWEHQSHLSFCWIVDEEMK
jgi:hypothetical protein